MKGLARLVGEIHPDIHITVVEGGGISSWLTILHIVSLLQLAGTSDTVSLREASLATPSI